MAVVRAGLEEVLVDPSLPENLRPEVHTLIGQTSRLTHVIEDLLLLSRLDAGRLEMNLHPENLRLLIDRLVDDLSILPETEKLDLQVKAADPVWVRGDRVYTSLILQNLMENARKYNRPAGRIQIVVTKKAALVECRIGNTGKTIPDALRERIFDRFHRGSSGEGLPGYGLGLNLARELALLHGGQLRLLQSKDDWTEFALTLPHSPPADDPQPALR